MRRLLLLFLALCLTFSAAAQSKRIFLWRDVPTMRGKQTHMYFYPVPSDTAVPAVIICPGGSYHHLGRIREGVLAAKWFNKHGVAAFVLHYRTAGRGYHYPAPLEDWQRAMQLVRERAARYGVDAQKVGTIGFSAGGHLVTMSGALAQENQLEQFALATETNLRPDWVAAIYPVVSMQDSLAHRWSRESLLHTNAATQPQKDRFSMEMRITADMPPLFLLASHDDPTVDVRNSIVLDKALTDRKIKHKFLLFPTGGHGYGMSNCTFAKTSQWRETLLRWLQDIQMVEKTK